MKISYHVSHEQFSASELLDLVRHAESAGFDAAFSSDHFQPWVPAQGHSAHLWAWLGSALQATTRMSFAAITIPGGWRHHPAMIAQAVATLSQMYPGRLPWLALGSGEALNESVVGEWPDKAERAVRLREGADIVRQLLRGATVTSDGMIPLRQARLWPRPPVEPVALVGAALSEATAAAVAEWADGLLTTAGTKEALERIVTAFRRVAPGKPMHAKVDLSWAPSDEQAMAQAREQWAFSNLPKDDLAELSTPEQFERAVSRLAKDIDPTVLVSSDFERHIDWLRQHQALGFETLNLHNVGRNQHEFIDAFGTHVLPRLRS